MFLEYYAGFISCQRNPKARNCWNTHRLLPTKTGETQSFTSSGPRESRVWPITDVQHFLELELKHGSGTRHSVPKCDLILGTKKSKVLEFVREDGAIWKMVLEVLILLFRHKSSLFFWSYQLLFGPMMSNPLQGVPGRRRRRRIPRTMLKKERSDFDVMRLRSQVSRFWYSDLRSFGPVSCVVNLTHLLFQTNEWKYEQTLCDSGLMWKDELIRSLCLRGSDEPDSLFFSPRRVPFWWKQTLTSLFSPEVFITTTRFVTVWPRIRITAFQITAFTERYPRPNLTKSLILFIFLFTLCII